MEPLVIVLVAGSAVLHVAWNVRLKSAGDTLLAATIGLLVGALVIVPVGSAVWWLDGANPLPPEGLALGLVSGLIEAIYSIPAPATSPIRTTASAGAVLNVTAGRGCN